jgi:uncharacterized DUF497 family protein
VIIEFDPTKSEKNARERKLPFERTKEFDWETALYAVDLRHAYPERRFVAIGYIGERLHVICFTPMEGGVRIISFRKANRREVGRYETKAADK